MYCNMKFINLNNKKSVNLKSNLNDNGIICTSFEDEQTKGEFQTTKGIKQFGQSINTTTLSARDITIEGVIVEENLTQIEILKRELIAVLNPLDDVLLEYTDDVIQKAIIVRAVSVPTFSSELNTNNLKSFMVQLDAEYPLWQDQIYTTINVETWKSNFEFPFFIEETGLEFASKGENKIEFINAGEMEAPLEFYFKAPALNPKIILNDEKYIKVNRQLNDRETLYICTAYGNTKVEIIKPNGERENAYGYIDINSTFFKLPVGSNIISYSTDGDFIPQSVIVKYKNQYLSL